MTKVNKFAWGILTQEEKLAVTLSLGHKKSSWEAGEIMSKSHYKFLEIVARAEKFLRMFTEFYNKYGDLVPMEVTLTRDVQEYLSMAIISRMIPRDIGEKMENRAFMVISYRDRKMDDQLWILKNSGGEANKDFLDLILEFDRWNNFRILPRYWQQESAFKRRIKGKELKYIKSICGLPKFSVDKLVEKYESPSGKIFTILVSEVFPGGFKVMRIKDKSINFSTLTAMGFPLYSKEIDAEELGYILAKYLLSKPQRGVSRVKMGLDFWEKFRTLLSKSTNYKEIMGIIPNRRFQEDAFIDNEIKRKKRLRELENLGKIK